MPEDAAAGTEQETEEAHEPDTGEEAPMPEDAAAGSEQELEEAHEPDTGDEVPMAEDAAAPEADASPLPEAVVDEDTSEQQSDGTG